MRQRWTAFAFLAFAACGGEETEETPASRGQPLYANSCASCHGAAGNTAVVQGAAILTSAETQQKTDDVLAGTIRDGKGTGMPAFSSQYSAAQISDIVAYVRSLAQ